MFLLAKLREGNEDYIDLQIASFQPKSGTGKAYRALFRNSVIKGPVPPFGLEWPKKKGKHFSIFKPSIELMIDVYSGKDIEAWKIAKKGKLYFHFSKVLNIDNISELEDLWGGRAVPDGIDMIELNYYKKLPGDTLQKEFNNPTTNHFHLFIMSLSEEDLQNYVENYDEEEFKRKYHRFIKSLQ